MAGVSKAAISKAPESKIKKMPDGKIDTDHPINVIYLAEHGANKKPPKSGIKKPAKAKQKTESQETETIPETDDDGIDQAALGVDMASWSLRDKRASALYKEAAERKLTLDHQKKKGELIERPQFINAVQGINKAIDDNLHRLPAKLGPILFAMSRQDGGTELAVIRELEKGMGDAIRRAIEDVSRLSPGAVTVAK